MVKFQSAQAAINMLRLMLTQADDDMRMFGAVDLDDECTGPPLRASSS